MQLRKVIDALGEMSAKAQNLGAVITTAGKFLAQSDNKIYFKVIGRRVVGFLKTGYRNLFYTNPIGRIQEIRPLCVLDFYIHESVQRHGYGKELFECMLLEEGILPSKLAIDRPSPKLISFMRKHYQLSGYVPQNNNFVVYNEYFETPASRVREQKQEYMSQRTERPVSRQTGSAAMRGLLTPEKTEGYQTSSSMYGVQSSRSPDQTDPQY